MNSKRKSVISKLKSFHSTESAYFHIRSSKKANGESDKKPHQKLASDKLSSSSMSDCHNNSVEQSSQITTKKANNIMKNAEITSLWTPETQARNADQDQPEASEENQLLFDELDHKQYVETIAEENEPESNLSTLMDNSLQEKQIYESNYQPDEMYVELTAKKVKVTPAIPVTACDVMRSEMNSTMKNFEKLQLKQPSHVEDMKTTAKFINAKSN